MDYATTGDELSFEASVAAVEQLQKLEKLVILLEKNAGATVLADAEQRAALARISAALGTDPLQISLQGLNAEQYKAERSNRICVAMIETCRDLQAQNGGSVPVSLLAQRLSRFFEFNVSSDDILKAVETLDVLGPGLRIEVLPNGTKVVRTVAGELSSDQGTVLVACDALGYVTTALLEDNLGWEKSRAQQVLDEMVSGGLLWVDTQCIPTQYWTPSVI